MFVRLVLESFLYSLGQVRKATLYNQAGSEGVTFGGWFIAQLGAGFVDCQQASTDQKILTLCDEQPVFRVDCRIGLGCCFDRLTGRLAGWNHGFVNLAKSFDVQRLDRIQAEDFDELGGTI